MKVAKLKGALAWHMHDWEDELFQVIYGSLCIEFRNDAEVILNPGEFWVVPKGVLHNPVADEECGIVQVETISTKHTGDENYASHQVNRRAVDIIRGIRCVNPS